MNASDPLGEALRLLKTIQAPLQRHELDPEGKATARKVEAALRKALEDPATRSRGLVELAWLCRWEGELEEAQLLFESALSLPPESAEWLEGIRGLADLHMMRAKLPAALGVLRRGLERHPKDPDLHYKEGSCLYYQGDREGAQRTLEQASGHEEAAALLRMVVRERTRPPEPEVPVDLVARNLRLDRALELALEALRKGSATAEEKAAVEAKLREGHRRRKES